jgi:SAM-dependent methyltransferase
LPTGSRPPLGEYLLEREQAWFDRTVADIFGFQAIQIGLPEYSFLAQSRIPARWSAGSQPPAQILADPHWLPFAENSLDLVVLPHALEFTSDPHQLLREVYRAMRAEGRSSSPGSIHSASLERAVISVTAKPRRGTAASSRCTGSRTGSRCLGSR